MKKASIWIASASGLTLALATMAQAQETGAAESTGVDEIIVTAQKRAERLIDVPLSITAASGEQLSKLGVSNTEDLEKVAPGFTFQRSSFGTPVFQIRGIGFYDTSVGASPTVSLYVDQVPLPYSSMARGAAFDLERVEVLKGPQGTLFGQNSTGGAINYIAAKPTRDVSAGFTLDYGRFNETNVQAHVSGPITNTLTARVAGRYEYRDGWQVGYEPNDSRLGKAPGDRLGKRRFYTGRFLLNWTPSDRLDVEFNANGWRDGSETQAAQYRGFNPVQPLNPFNANVYAAFAPLDIMPQEPRLAGWDAGRDYGRDDHFYQFALRGNYAISDTVTLTAISALSRYREISLVDIDGVAFPDYTNTRRARIESFSQELRLAGDSGRVRWMVGGNYARDLTFERQNNLLGSTNAGLGPLRYNAVELRNDQRIRTWAAFASLDYALTDQLTVQASARYTTQDRSYEGCLADPDTDGRFAFAFATAFGIPARPGGCVTQAAPPPAPPTLPPSIVSDLDQDNLSWRAGLNWKPGPDTLIYANVTKGYKAGGYSLLPAVFASQLDPVTQESVLAYEAGFKTAAADNRVQISGAVFYYDYRDKQVLGSANIVPFGNLPKLINVPESRVVGAEANLTLEPVDGLRFSGGVTYVDSKVKIDPPNAVDAYGNATTYVGSPFPNTPRWQGVADAEYRFRAGDSHFLSFGASVRARSRADAVFNGSLLPPPADTPLKIPGYALLDLRAGVESADGTWRFTLWGRNVTNRYYILNNAHLVDTGAVLTGMPATYGMTLGFRY